MYYLFLFFTLQQSSQGEQQGCVFYVLGFVMILACYVTGSSIHYNKVIELSHQGHSSVDSVSGCRADRGGSWSFCGYWGGISLIFPFSTFWFMHFIPNKGWLAVYTPLFY